MTTTQAVHLIEQFAAQAPFAVWITDSRGVSIFANRKLHEIFAIPEHPSGALGFNLFEDPAIASLGLQETAKRLRDGGHIDVIIDVPKPSGAGSRVDVRRQESMLIRVNGYPLKANDGKIEHFVILITDVTETARQREELRVQLRDLAIYGKSREARIERLRELEADVVRLQKELRNRGVEPAA